MIVENEWIFKTVYSAHMKLDESQRSNYVYIFDKISKFQIIFFSISRLKNFKNIKSFKNYINKKNSIIKKISLMKFFL